MAENTHRRGIADQRRGVIHEILGEQGVRVGQDILQGIDILRREHLCCPSDDRLQIIHVLFGQQALDVAQGTEKTAARRRSGRCHWIGLGSGIGIGIGGGQGNGRHGDEGEQEAAESHDFRDLAQA